MSQSYPNLLAPLDLGFTTLKTVSRWGRCTPIWKRRKIGTGSRNFTLNARAGCCIDGNRGIAPNREGGVFHMAGLFDETDIANHQSLQTAFIRRAAKLRCRFCMRGAMPMVLKCRAICGKITHFALPPKNWMKRALKNKSAILWRQRSVQNPQVMTVSKSWDPRGILLTNFRPTQTNVWIVGADRTKIGCDCLLKLWRARAAVGTDLPYLSLVDD